jgi:hypothetical protein
LVALFLHGGEPILPEKDADLAGRLRKRIVGEKSEDVRAAFEEAFFGAGDDGIGTPMT